MSANDAAARVTQQEIEKPLDIKTETTTTTSERTPFLVSDILTTSTEIGHHPMAAAANGFEAGAESATVAETEEAMAANNAEGNAGYAGAGSPNGGEDGGGELGANHSLTHSRCFDDFGALRSPSIPATSLSSRVRVSRTGFLLVVVLVAGGGEILPIFQKNLNAEEITI